MTPEQIDAVRRTWADALLRPEAVTSDVAARLDGDEGGRDDRAAWAVGTVTRLLLVLDRPTAFTATAGTELAQLPRLTLGELTDVQEALLVAVRGELGGLDPVEELAWRRAFALFRELVGAQHLDPFRANA